MAKFAATAVHTCSFILLHATLHLITHSIDRPYAYIIQLRSAQINTVPLYNYYNLLLPSPNPYRDWLQKRLVPELRRTGTQIQSGVRALEDRELLVLLWIQRFFSNYSILTQASFTSVKNAHSATGNTALHKLSYIGLIIASGKVGRVGLLLVFLTCANQVTPYHLRNIRLHIFQVCQFIIPLIWEPVQLFSKPMSFSDAINIYILAKEFLLSRNAVSKTPNLFRTLLSVFGAVRFANSSHVHCFSLRILIS